MFLISIFIDIIVIDFFPGLYYRVLTHQAEPLCIIYDRTATIIITSVLWYIANPAANPKENTYLLLLLLSLDDGVYNKY